MKSRNINRETPYESGFLRGTADKSKQKYRVSTKKMGGLSLNFTVKMLAEVYLRQIYDKSKNSHFRPMALLIAPESSEPEPAADTGAVQEPEPNVGKQSKNQSAQVEVSNVDCGSEFDNHRRLSLYRNRRPGTDNPRQQWRTRWNILRLRLFRAPQNPLPIQASRRDVV